MVFHLDPVGIGIVICVYILLIYGDYATTFHVIKLGREEEVNIMDGSLDSDSESNVWTQYMQACVVHFFAIMAAISHVICMLSNPGYVDKSRNKVDFSEMQSLGKSVKTGVDEELNINDWTMCAKCETYKPPRAHHCKKCRRCVKKMDHHCPWMNNCVGEWNRKYFLLFLLYTNGLCCFSFLMISINWLHDWNGLQTKNDSILVTILLFEVVIFGLFTGAIGLGQIISILMDRSAIEIMKFGYDFKAPKDKIRTMQGVLGKGLCIWWFVPCVSPKFPELIPPDSHVV